MKHPSFLFIILILLAFTGARADNIEVSGPVSGTWSADTVFVVGDIILNSGESLSIAPGTLVLFAGHYKFKVSGSVNAEGTESSPIRFTIADTTGHSDTLTTSGGWFGLEYEHLAAATDSSIFRYCVFEYGKALSADTFGMYGGAFRIFDFGKIAFRQCTFSHNMAIRWGGAVYAENADILVDGCTFTDNRCGLSLFPWGYGGGLCSVSSGPVVINTTFEGNIATGYGGGASFEFSDPELHHNIFTGNYGGLAGGFGFLRSTPSRVVSNNLVTGNAARFFGGGVACNRASPVFSNNTITDNHSSYGGGFYCNDSAVPLIYNSIIRGNTGFGHEVYIWDVRSAPSFFYCNIEGDTSGFEGSGAHEGFAGEYVNNIDGDALFRGAGDFPYALQPSSPCVDAGTEDTTGLQVPTTDLEGVSRVYNGRIDIGAYERNPGQGTGEQTASQITITAYPNPFRERLHIRGEGMKGTRCEVRITDLSGQTVACICDIPVTRGNFLIEADREVLQRILTYSNIYIITCYDLGNTYSVKLINAGQQ